MNLVRHFIINQRLKEKNTVCLSRHVPNNIVNMVGKNVVLGKDVYIYKSSVYIGDYSYINGGKIFYAKIGKYCSLAYGIYIGSGEHYISRVSTFPLEAKFLGLKASNDFPEQKDTIIGNDVWIGNNVCIKQGVNVGHGAIIASGAVVTHDVPPYAIVGGVRAKVIKYRFKEDIIESLLRIKWWEWPEEQLTMAISHGEFLDTELFVKKYNPIFY